jgi:UDP-glucose 4-epimerase
MRIVVTGGAGFIGSHVADAFVAAGHEVLVLDDLSTGRRENVPAGAAFVEVDIRDAEAVQAAFAGFRPEIVDHQAAQTSVSVSTREPVRDAEINVVGTINVLQACVRHRVSRVVFASTGGAIYGEVPDPERAVVGRPTHPLSPYACSKLAGEHYLYMFRHEHGLPYTVLRYANVYGPRQDPHGEAGVVAIFSQRLVAGAPIRINAMRDPGDPGCIRDYVSVTDVVKANVAAVGPTGPEGGSIQSDILNVCTGVPTTTLDIARGLASALGVEPQLEHGPRRAGDLERSVLDPTAFVALLGPPVPLAEGLAETARWFRHRAAASP